MLQTAVRRSVRTRPLPAPARPRHSDRPSLASLEPTLVGEGLPMAARAAILLVLPGCAGHRDKHCVAEPRMLILAKPFPPANALYGVHLGGCSEGPHVVE